VVKEGDRKQETSGGNVSTKKKEGVGGLGKPRGGERVYTKRNLTLTRKTKEILEQAKGTKREEAERKNAWTWVAREKGMKKGPARGGGEKKKKKSGGRSKREKGYKGEGENKHFRVPQKQGHQSVKKQTPFKKKTQLNKKEKQKKDWGQQRKKKLSMSPTKGGKRGQSKGRRVWLGKKKAKQATLN